jgi:GNAT superfamily N-acetyltransferase
MQFELRPIASLAAARAHCARLDAAAAEFHAQFSDQPYPKGSAERFLARHFEAPETVLMAAFVPGGDVPVGLCLVGPSEDPLSGERLPVVLVLHVDPNLRHRGIATALVAQARQVLLRRGLDRLAARAGHNDDALISMGERWGFVRAWEWMQIE